MKDPKLTLLGNQGVEYPTAVDKDILETFENPAPDERFYVTFEQIGEFTSLCPKTAQPDFADIRILYSPSQLCVESKSLKLYLFSYRNAKGFGETITNQIADHLYEVLAPKFVVVIGAFRARGGIAWKTEAIREGVDDMDEFDKIELVKFR